MSAEFDHRYGPALIITLGALFSLLGRECVDGLEAVFPDHAF